MIAPYPTRLGPTRLGSSLLFALLILGAAGCGDDAGPGADGGDTTLPDGGARDGGTDAGVTPLPPFPSYPGEGDACEMTVDCPVGGRLVCVSSMCVKADRLDPALITYDFENHLLGAGFAEPDNTYGDRGDSGPETSFSNYLYSGGTMEIVVGGGFDDYSDDANECQFGILGNSADTYRIDEFACSAFARGPDGSLIVGGLSRAEATLGVPGFVIFDAEQRIEHRILMGPEVWASEMAEHEALMGLERPEVSLGPPTSIIWHDGAWIAVLGLGDSWSDEGDLGTEWSFLSADGTQLISRVPRFPTEHTALRVEPGGSIPTVLPGIALVHGFRPALARLGGGSQLIVPEFDQERDSDGELVSYWSGPVYMVDVASGMREQVREWSPLAGVLVQPTSPDTSVVTWMALDSPCGFGVIMEDGEWLPGAYMSSSTELQLENYPDLSTCHARERLNRVSNYVGNTEGHLGSYLPSHGWVYVSSGFSRGMVDPREVSADGITAVNVWGPVPWNDPFPTDWSLIQRFGVTAEVVATRTVREIPILYPVDQL